MRIRILQLLLALGLCVVLTPATALAYRGHGGRNGNNHKADRGDDRDRAGQHDRDDDKDRDHAVRHDDRERDNDRDRDGDRDRQTPPGWKHGRKTGWGNCNTPPGLAKKSGCHSKGDGDHDRSDRRVAGSRPSAGAEGGIRSTTTAQGSAGATAGTTPRTRRAADRRWTLRRKPAASGTAPVAGSTNSNPQR